MQAEIHEQPIVLAENGERYYSELKSALGGQRFELVLIAARGSSDNAALYARYLIEIHLGIPVCLAAPSVFTRYRANVNYPKCLAIGISQSGAAPDVAEVLEELRGQGHTTLAITNTPSSKITKVAEHTLLLGVGPERSVAATKTYTASLLGLYQLVRAMRGELPEPSLPNSEWLSKCGSLAEVSAPHVLCAKILFSLARGYEFSSANECALKLMECALLPCKAYSVADFQHGPKALAGPSSLSIVFGDPPDDCGPLLKSPALPNSVCESVGAIWSVIFCQMLALTCARKLGLNPDQPEGLSKVTRTF